MPLLDGLKASCVYTGLYRPVQQLTRRFRPAVIRTHLAEIHFYKSLLPPSALCFDVGANIGRKSETMLRAGGRVVAFEPSPVAQLELRARCGRDKDWTLLPAAVGAQGGIAALHAVRDSARSSFIQGWAEDVINIYHVPVVTLDAAIKTFGRPFYCKIDVEGWELEVLKGLSQPIPLVSFEFHLNQVGVIQTLSCLERLSGFGDQYVNIAPAETSLFQFRDWRPLEEFMEWFPGDLQSTLPRYSRCGYLYGDIFIKRPVDARSCS